MKYETEYSSTYKRSVKNLEYLLKMSKGRLQPEAVLILEECIFILKMQPQYEPNLLNIKAIDGKDEPS